MKHKIPPSNRLVILLASLCIGMSIAMGQGSANNSGASGSAFLNIGVGARAMGMGGAVASFIDDPTALYWNPSGIAGIDRIEIAAEQNRWVADMQHSFFGAVVPLTDQFKFGASVIYLTSGDIEMTTIDQPRGTGTTYAASDLSLGATLGWSVTNAFSVGATIKYIRNTLYTLTSGGLGFDVGTRFNTQYHGITVALAVSNLGGMREYRGDALDFQYPPPYPGAAPIHASFNNTQFSLPVSYRAGVGTELFEFLDQPIEGQKLRLAADLLQPYDSPEKLNMGGEYAYNNSFFLRTGYIFNADELGFNAGAGVRVNVGGVNLRADYGYASLKRFDAVHRFGIGIEL